MSLAVPFGDLQEFHWFDLHVTKTNKKNNKTKLGFAVDKPTPPLRREGEFRVLTPACSLPSLSDFTSPRSPKGNPPNEGQIAESSMNNHVVRSCCFIHISVFLFNCPHSNSIPPQCTPASNGLHDMDAQYECQHHKSRPTPCALKKIAENHPKEVVLGIRLSHSSPLRIHCLSLSRHSYVRKDPDEETPKAVGNAGQSH